MVNTKTTKTLSALFQAEYMRGKSPIVYVVYEQSCMLVAVQTIITNGNIFVMMTLVSDTACNYSQ